MTAWKLVSKRAEKSNQLAQGNGQSCCRHPISLQIFSHFHWTNILLGTYKKACMCTPTHRIKLITQTQTQDALPTRCNNPQVETRLRSKSAPLCLRMGKPAVQTAKWAVCSLITLEGGSYGEWVILKWRRLKWLGASVYSIVCNRVCSAVGSWPRCWNWHWQ